MANIGIIGGSFDPIHYGHLFIAEWIRDAFDIAKILFIPTNESPFKQNQTITFKEDRYNMLKIALEHNKNFEISRIDIDRPPPSYTVKTLKILYTEYTDHNLFFILGSDAFMDIKKWKNYKQILKLTRLIVVPRESVYTSYLIRQEWIKQNLCEYHDKITFIDMPVFSVSSTLIRQRIKKGLSVRYMIPDKVLNYINMKNLYL